MNSPFVSLTCWQMANRLKKLKKGLARLLVGVHNSQAL